VYPDRPAALNLQWAPIRTSTTTLPLVCIVTKVWLVRRAGERHKVLQRVLLVLPLAGNRLGVRRRIYYDDCCR
jgi:hypothetical protein